MENYRNKVQLDIGKHCEKTMMCLFDILSENHSNRQAIAVIGEYLRLLDNECRSAQYQLSVKNDASAIDKVYSSYLRRVSR